MKRDYGPLAILLIAVLIVLSPVLFTGSTYFLRDLTYIFHPWRTLTAECVQKGSMPLWNPYAYCGMPLLANWQTAVFYPLSLPFYFFSFVTGLKLYHAAHLLIAGIFAYLWGRSIGLRRGASAGVMAVWAFNGYMIGRLEFLSLCGVDAWIFALFLLSRHPALLATAFSLVFFAGHYIAALAAVVLFLYRLLMISGGARAGMRFWVVSGSIAAGLIACQFLPTFELFIQTGRYREGISAAVALTNAITLSDLTHLVNPFLTASSVPSIAGEKYSWITAFHIGVVAFSCCIYACVRPKNKLLLLFSGVLFAGGLLLALGGNTGLYPWLYHTVPLLSAFRYPAQFLLLTMIASAILAGAGLHRMKAARYVVIAILCELVFLSWGFQITAPRDYYYTSSPAVTYFQSHPGQGRFILSPGTEKDRHLSARTTQDAWQAARAMLYNLTCLPYHIPNAYGSGEPLTHAGLENSVNAAYTASTARAAVSSYQRLGAAFLVCKNPLPPDSGYDAILPHVYAVPGMPAQAPLKEVSFPGWQVYIDGKKASYSSKSDVFRAVDLPAGRHAVYEVYRPFSFHMGVFLTIMTILVLCAAAVRASVKGVCGRKNI